MEDIREMLKKVAAGELSVDNAVLELKKEPFTFFLIFIILKLHRSDFL